MAHNGLLGVAGATAETVFLLSGVTSITRGGGGGV